MAHGGYRRRRVAVGRPVGGGRRSKGPGVERKLKSVSLKNQIRSIERMLKKVCYFRFLPTTFFFFFFFADQIFVWMFECEKFCVFFYANDVGIWSME